MKLLPPKTNHQAGFTIVELLIATLLFTIILIVVTAGILQFSRQYYNGVIASRTQNTTRAIVDDITRAIQFNSGTVSILTSGNGFCVGESKRYSYKLNQQIIDGRTLGPRQGRHALVSDSVTGCTTATAALNVGTLPSALPIGSRELLGERMRLVKISISGSDPYTITARVVYGDSDLLCSPTVNGTGDCNVLDSTDGVDANMPDLKCRLENGSQYCAVSELSTTVKKRVTQ